MQLLFPALAELGEQGIIDLVGNGYVSGHGHERG